MTFSTLHIRAAAALTLALFAAACVQGPSGDSETHWTTRPALSPCDVSDQCEDQMACICGICTLECHGPNACGDIEGTVCVQSFEERNATCQSSPTVQSPGLCMLPCAEDSGCNERATGLTCNAGHCSPAANPERPDVDPDARDVDPDARNADPDASEPGRADENLPDTGRG